jgi:cell wall-associated NlpC family hydrolase
MPHHNHAAVILAAAAALLLTIVIIIGAAGGASLTGTLDACQQPAPSGTAASIPASYLAGYIKAGQKYHIPWTVLAGVGEVESGHGRSGLPGVHSGANPYGAAGPMQIGTGGAAGNTWGGSPVHPASEHTGGYGLDGDGDGIADVYDPGDAIPAAAAYLAASGAPGNIPAALTAYNHSAQYVAAVLAWAARYAATGAQALAAASTPACQDAALPALPAGTAGIILAYAEQQIGKPYAFSWGPGGQIRVNPGACPAQMSDPGNAAGATGVVDGMSARERCAAARVILFAASQAGKPYVWGATGPDAYDCSGLTMMAYRAAGMAIPRTSQDQWAAGPWVPSGQEEPGDLVFFAGSDGTVQAPGHVGVYAGNGLMIDAPYAGVPVRVDPVAGAVGFTRPAAGG